MASQQQLRQRSRLSTSFGFIGVLFHLLDRIALPLAVLCSQLLCGAIAASPVAGSLIDRVPAGWIAAFGAALSGAGLYLIGGWRPDASWVAMVTPLVLQGFGVGLFQVAYMGVVMATLPPQHRGVAGSLTMLTRTVGVVTGAALLTLVFHALEASALSSGTAPGNGFITAFGGTFRLAAATAGLAALVMALSMTRHRRR